MKERKALEEFAEERRQERKINKKGRRDIDRLEKGGEREKTLTKVDRKSKAEARGIDTDTDISLG